MKWIAIAALFIAILFGATVAHVNQISTFAFAPNFGAVILAVVVIFFGSRTYTFLFNNIFHVSAAAIILLELTLYFDGYDHVRRWIFVGPFQLNVSMTFAPLLLLGLFHLRVWESLVMGVVVSLIYYFQPDASQASAFAISASMIFFSRNDFNLNHKFLGSFFMIACAVATWFQIEDLPAVPQAEEILKLAFAQGPLFIAGGALAISFLLLPMVLIVKKSRLVQKRVFVGSLLTFWLITFITTELGHFPVPAIGAGAAGVLGLSLTYVLIFGFEPNDSASNLSSSN